MTGKSQPEAVGRRKTRPFMDAQLRIFRSLVRSVRFLIFQSRRRPIAESQVSGERFGRAATPEGCAQLWANFLTHSTASFFSGSQVRTVAHPFRTSCQGVIGSTSFGSHLRRPASPGKAVLPQHPKAV